MAAGFIRSFLNSGEDRPQQDRVEEWSLEIRTALSNDGLTSIESSVKDIYSRNNSFLTYEGDLAYEIGFSAGRVVAESNIGRNDILEQVQRGVSRPEVNVNVEKGLNDYLEDSYEN